MIEKYVTPGQKVDLRAVKRQTAQSENTPPERTYTTKVFDVISEDRMEILMPIEATKLILLPVDGEYEMFFYTEDTEAVEKYSAENLQTDEAVDFEDMKGEIKW